MNPTNPQPTTPATTPPTPPATTPTTTASLSDPWTVKPSGGEPIPQGAYLAVFDTVEPFNAPEKGIHNKWRWAWTITNGQHAGKKPSALTDQAIKPTTLPGRLITGMAGRAIVDHENVKSLVDSFKGQTFMIIYGPGPKGGKPQVQSANLPPSQ
jgi:hypothetical protein